MPWFKWFLAIGTLCFIVFFQCKHHAFKKVGAPGILNYQLSRYDEAQEILYSWENHELIDNACRITKWDFYFIPFYVLLMLNLSALQMNLEKTVFLNRLLRLNMLLAFSVGVLDVWENILFINSLDQMKAANSHVISIAKLILAGWIILVWTVSCVKRLVTR